MPENQISEKFQSVAYIKTDGYLFSKRDVDEINKFCFHEFEISPLPIKIPPDSPAEIPRLIITNAAQDTQITINLLRIDFYYFPIKVLSNSETPYDLDQFVQYSQDIFSFIHDLLDICVHRIALVNVLQDRMRDDPREWLKNQFINNDRFDDYLQNLENLKLRIDRRTNIGQSDNQYFVNNIIGINTIRHNEERYLQYYFDVNTVQDTDENRYNKEQIVQFLNLAKIEINRSFSQVTS